MAIPVYLQKYKAAGIYRIVFDKSTILGVDAEILRLVVGYSEKGPFNTPVYITSASEFTAIYGKASRKLEKRGVFFHRLAQQALSSGPILALNLKVFTDEVVGSIGFNPVDICLHTNDRDGKDEYSYAEELKNEWSKARMAFYEGLIEYNKKMKKYADDKAAGKPAKLPESNLDSLKQAMEDAEAAYKDYLVERHVDSGDFATNSVKYLSLEDIYDTTRFWKLDEKQLADVNSVKTAHKEVKFTVDGSTKTYEDPTSAVHAVMDDNGDIAYTRKALDGYIRIAATNVDALSNTIVFRRCTNIATLNAYNITVRDWFADETEGVPEYLQGYEDRKISDFIVDMYIFRGKFTEGVTAEESLGNYIAWAPSPYVPYDQFADMIKFMPYVPNAFGDKLDTLDQLYFDDRSGAIAKYTGFTIPYFMDKTGTYQSIDILFNQDNDTHYMMMYLDNTALENGTITAEQIIAPEPAFTKDGLEAQYKIIDKVRNAASAWEAYKNAKAESDKIKAEKTTIDINADTVEQQLESAKTGIKEAKDAIVASVEYLCKNPQYGWDDPAVELEFDEEKDTAEDKANKAYNKIYNAYKYYGWPADKSKLTDNLSESKVKALKKYLTGKKEDEKTTLDKAILNEVAFTTDLLAAYESYNKALDDLAVIEENANLTTQADAIMEEWENEWEGYTATNNGLEVEDTLVVTDSGLTSAAFDLIADNGINYPTAYLAGYTYSHPLPTKLDVATGVQVPASDDYNCNNWIKNYILEALVKYKGLRVGLVSKADIEYRYIVDTFKSFIEPSCKAILCGLAKEKQSAFAILNFPAVSTFKQHTSKKFIDPKTKQFDVNEVVNAVNGFSLPADSEGASFCAFYTPLKFSEAGITSIVPSAALVSNNFMTKYTSRQPYYIVAGQNYGLVSYGGMVGPDYNWSQDELQIIEPYGVNCMIFRPRVGTFINANQTAKQTPKSALSLVNVRELVIYLQDEIEKVLQQYQWEFNTADIRAKIVDRANYICSQVQARGGLYAFLNVMDASNNTPDIIDNEMCVLSTHIEPGKGCGKMIQELTIYRTGQMAASITEG